VISGIATLEEIERYWNINDLYDAHEAMDIKEELEQHVIEATKVNPRGRR